MHGPLILAAGLTGIAASMLVGRRLSRNPGFHETFRHVNALRLPFAVFGAVVALLIPLASVPGAGEAFDALRTFCITWIGISFGFTLDMRHHRTFRYSGIASHIAEPALIILAIVTLGALVDAFSSFTISFVQAAFVIGIVGSLTVIKKSSPSAAGDPSSFRFLFHELVPARNLPGIVALGLSWSFFPDTPAPPVFGITLTGGLSIFTLHVIAGIFAGIIMSMLSAGINNPSNHVTVLVCMTAIAGGASVALGLSPLFIGTAGGFFLINGTLNRPAVLDAGVRVSRWVEPLLMVCLGFVMVSALGAPGPSPWVIVPTALGLCAVRAGLAYLLATHWRSQFTGFIDDMWLMWSGFMAQGFLAVAAALELAGRPFCNVNVFVVVTLTLAASQLAAIVLIMIRTRSMTAES